MASTGSRLPSFEAYWSDDFTPLEAAGNAILGALREDEAAPDADLYRRITSPEPNSHLYFPPEAQPASKDPPTPTVMHRRTAPLPSFLREEMKKTKISSMMGLLADAELAWLSVDEKLFLWSYNTPASSRLSGMDDFCSYTVPSGRCIVSVGLIRPKKGVFRKFVEWCLVITTDDEAILCALAREDGAADQARGFSHGTGSLRLVRTKFAISSDCALLSVCGTNDGRVFLGGEDGCLYEMQYQGCMDEFVKEERQTIKGRLDAFYDEGVSTPEVIVDEGRAGNGSFLGRKRVLSSIVFGASSPGHSTPSLKCRKLKHGSNASSLAAAIVPEIILKTGSLLLGRSHNSTGGGPIVKIVIDEERSCLYSLSTLGWICTFDLRSQGGKGLIELRACMDAPKTACSYLEHVSRGKLFPPRNPPPGISNIVFPGGGAAAQAGVGGMDGARTILKLADVTSKPRTRARIRRRGRESEIGQMLKPISLHVVKRQESDRLTLVAITKGGLRYYISSISPRILSSGPSQHFGTDRRVDPLAPSKDLTLCHIRAPPSVSHEGKNWDLPAAESENGDVSGGLVPRIPDARDKVSLVVSSAYNLGVLLLSLDPKEKARDTSNSIESEGDMIVAACPDSVMRKKEQKETPASAGPNQQLQTSAPRGVCEALCLPMSTAYGVSDSSLLLPGGRVWDMCWVSNSTGRVLGMTLNSRTPSDSELGVGLVAAFLLSERTNRTASQHTLSSGVPGAGGPNEQNSQTLAHRSYLPAAGTIATAGVMLGKFLLSRPFIQGVAYHKPRSEEEINLHGAPTQKYRISASFGSTGFSLSAGEEKSRIQASRSASRSKSTPKSQRLSPWLLRPAVVPLNLLAIQHVLSPPEVVTFNVGGLHFFGLNTVLSRLESALMAALDVSTDEAVNNFFASYGHKEGCAMCLSLSISQGRSKVLRSQATGAALAKAFRPKLVPLIQIVGHGIEQAGGTTSNVDAFVPPGYQFRASALYEGLVSLTSRLLRPVWYKPAVVVTEGRTIRTGSSMIKVAPAKVELLLDGPTLEQIRNPLFALQEVMKEVFPPTALHGVPGITRKDNFMMDIDEGSGQQDFVTRAIHHQNQLRSADVAANGQLAPSDAEELARLLEERNVHSIYRLLSRTVQLLSLISLLHRAHSMAELQEVEWGLLHGLTVSQLVQTKGGQERLESVLNALVSTDVSRRTEFTSPSAQSDRIAEQLSRECYLFFSQGARFAFLGFRSANEALAAFSSSVKRDHAKQAVTYLRLAAEHWTSAPLITGGIIESKDRNNHELLAKRAIQSNSPLAKAVELLIMLEDVGGAVDVCLITASNFGGAKSGRNATSDALRMHDLSTPFKFPWEQNLYQKKNQLAAGNEVELSSRTSRISTSSPSSKPLALATNVTPRDALATCHALLYHHVSKLLDSQRGLGEEMLAVCASATDTSFLDGMFSHLLRCNQEDTLIRIASPRLEKWLTGQENKSNLLRRYYVIHNKNSQAGDFCWSRATDPQTDLEINERISHLDDALSAYRTGLTISEGTPDHRKEDLNQKITQVRETLDVARLQAQVLSAVRSTRHELDNDKIFQLSHKIVHISDLYNNYAGPLCLFDLCLKILHSCRHNDVGTIELMWKGVLCEQLFPCSTRSEQVHGLLQSFINESPVDGRIVLLGRGTPANDAVALFDSGNWMMPLARKIAGIGRDVYGKGADYVFPVDFLIRKLEFLRHLYSASDPNRVEKHLGWPMMVLVDAGVPYLAALVAFDSMSDIEEYGGITPGQRLEQLQSIIALLSFWVSGARDCLEDKKSQLSRAVTSGRLIERIDSYKAQLEALPPPCDVTRDSDRLRAVEDMIRSIVGVF